MNNDYLLDKQDELRDQHFECSKEMDELSTRLKEVDKFIDMLESTKTKPFTEFSPQIVNDSDKRKLEDLQEQHNNIVDKISLKKDKLTNIENEIEKLSETYKMYKQNISATREQYLNQLNDIKVKLLRTKELIYSDPRRAALEIDNIISKIINK